MGEIRFGDQAGIEFLQGLYRKAGIDAKCLQPDWDGQSVMLSCLVCVAGAARLGIWPVKPNKELHETSCRLVNSGCRFDLSRRDGINFDLSRIAQAAARDAEAAAAKAEIARSLDLIVSQFRSLLR